MACLENWSEQSSCAALGRCSGNVVFTIFGIKILFGGLVGGVLNGVRGVGSYQLLCHSELMLR